MTHEGKLCHVQGRVWRSAAVAASKVSAWLDSSKELLLERTCVYYSTSVGDCGLRSGLGISKNSRGQHLFIFSVPYSYLMSFFLSYGSRYPWLEFSLEEGREKVLNTICLDEVFHCHTSFLSKKFKLARYPSTDTDRKKGEFKWIGYVSFEWKAICLGHTL